MTGLLVLTAVLLLAAAFGLYRRRSDGRVRDITPEVTVDRLTATQLGSELGDRATLVQFSSAFCAPCRATRVLLADVSLGMLRKAPLSALKPVCGGSESLPFADDSFERVIMVDALHHVIDHAHSAREMFRVLKPGGVLVIEEPDIRTFGVKLIAIAEKLLLMRSHFLAPDAILKLFPSGEKQVKTVDGTAWVIIKK